VSDVGLSWDHAGQAAVRASRSDIVSRDVGFMRAVLLADFPRERSHAPSL
jgi:hypothetical protein